MPLSEKLLPEIGGDLGQGIGLPDRMPRVPSLGIPLEDLDINPIAGSFGYEIVPPSPCTSVVSLKCLS